MTGDPFHRDVDKIDADLAEQVAKRIAGTNELLHALFVIERATLVIDRLIEERCRVSKGEPKREAARSR